MNKLILEYPGMRDFSDNKIYKDAEDTYFSKNDYGDIIYIGKDIDNNPYGSIKNIDKYKDLEVVTVGDENLPTEAERFNYMMLDRLRMDCDWNLGSGKIYGQRIWADTMAEHIAEMKRLYNSFTDDKKPEWLAWEQILEYEKKLV